jgi:hypothetical protein
MICIRSPDRLNSLMQTTMSYVYITLMLKWRYSYRRELRSSVNFLVALCTQQEAAPDTIPFLYQFKEQT